MAEIQVYLLNFHGFTSHIEIVLEKKLTFLSSYYSINRWEEPSDAWSIDDAELKGNIEEASSVYRFCINADPKIIVEKWKKYWIKTEKDAGIFGKNCAVATQWFLSNFADIPEPSLTNVSLNHLALGFMWPSFIPCPVTLPGRVMSNAKFHRETKNNPEVAKIVDKYSRLFLYMSMALATFIFAASVFALAVAATILSGGIAALAITSCVVVGFGSSYGFFKAYNLLSKKNSLEKLREAVETTSSLPSLLPRLA